MDRRFSVLLTALVLGLSLSLPHAASAQTPSTIPAGIVTSPNVTLAQRDEIVKIVTPMLQRLAIGSDEQVAVARQNILRLFDSALTLQGTPAFFATMSDIVAGGLEPAAKSDRIICRINTMLICSRALSPRSLPILTRGLQDSAPAVRYAAAQAMAMMLDPEITGQDPITALDAGAFRAMVELLSKSLDNEKSPTIIAQAALAMSRIPLDDAREITLASLQKTLTLLKAKPKASLSNELTALREVYLSDARSNSFARARLLAETGLGYVAMAASDMDNSSLDLSSAMRQQRQQLMDVGLVTVKFAASEDSGVAALQSDKAKAEIENLERAIAQNKWIDVQLHVAELLALLKS